MTGVNVKRDDVTGDTLATQGPAMRLLRVVWSALLDGAAMYGAAIHGYPNPEHFQSDVASRRTTDEQIPVWWPSSEQTHHALHRIRRQYQRSVT